MRRALLFALMLACIVDGHASSLQISPVMLELREGQGAAGITLRNPDDKPLYGQVRVFRWDQSIDDDSLTPTQELLASPPLIEIPAHGEQLIRLVRRATANPESEQTYRLLIDEIPPPDASTTSGVTIRLRYSVPVFVEPSGAPATPIVSWHLRRDQKGWVLRAVNDGKRHAQISAVQLVNASGKAFVVEKGLLGYALSGRARQWHVELVADADLHAPLRVRATVNALPTEGDVVVDSSP